MALQFYDIVRAAHEHGFELAGLTPALPAAADYQRYLDWVQAGHAGRMSYLADHRAGVREDPRNLLPSAKSILCVGKLYNTSPRTNHSTPDQGWISRYAWGEDYHDTIRRDLERLVAHLQTLETFEYRICVDTAPLLERTYARLAGLGWIGKNTCLINQQQGSWFLLGEVLLSLDLAPKPAPPPDRCGSCTRCIDACPTAAIVPDPRREGGWKLDASQCISYFTIELKGEVPEAARSKIGNQIFGCDICQDVCPWNRRAPETEAGEFQARQGRVAPDLGTLADLNAAEFRTAFQGSPVSRAKYAGFLRNVAVAMGNSGEERFLEPLERLACAEEAVIRSHALWALDAIRGKTNTDGP